MSKSATFATQHEGRCPKVPRLPRNMKVDVKKCHARQRKLKSMSKSATHATQHGRRCHQAPCLPHKMYVANSDSNKWFYPLSLCRNLCYPVPIQIIPMLLPFRLLGGGGGWGSRLLLLQGVGICVISCHVPIQIIPMVLPFRLLARWGGAGVHDCCCFRELEFVLSVVMCQSR